MSKKILIYGLAFGSACAALNYIYTSSAIYKNSSTMNLLFILLELLIIPAIGIFMFLKAFRDEKPDQFTVGKAVFLGFFVSVMIGCSVSLLVSYFIQFKPEYINQLISYRINQARIKGAELGKTKEEIANMETNIRFAYSTGQQFISQLFAGAARGLFFSAIFGYILVPKKPVVKD